MTKRNEPDSDLCFKGKPIPAEEAQAKWPDRYRSIKAKTEAVPNDRSSKARKARKNPSSNDKKENPKNGSSKSKKKNQNNAEEKLEAKRHYKQAVVDGVTLSLGDDVYVQAEQGKPNHIAKIVELFEATDGEPWFRARWFYRAVDTVIQDLSALIDDKRVFLSDVEDDNHLGCIYSSVNIAKVPLMISSGNEKRVIPPCELFYDMNYEMAHLTFSSANDANPTALPANPNADSEASSSISTESDESNRIQKPKTEEKFLLDLYSGCGAMSTGLCMGASLAEVKLKTKWAVDLNEHACRSLKLNHPDTEVRNEKAEDFLGLLKGWEQLCMKFKLITRTGPVEAASDPEEEEQDGDESDDGDEDSTELPPEVFEVEELLAICFGDPNKVEASELHFKVRWKGYGPEEDTWEPIKGLGDCPEKLRKFVTNGFNKKLLPLPGDAYFVCGGPPCQGVSGFNRFRNKLVPLEDEKNIQMEVYMDIVEFLKPQYVLMENVVDLLKFSGGFLGRYAVGRLVSMRYQTRLGMMAAGSYGVPQMRNRVFLWGAQPTQCLPPYPLPTHNTFATCIAPVEFKAIQVGVTYNGPLKDALTLGDAFKELPTANNHEEDDERDYGVVPETDFQKFISLKRSETIDGGDASKPRKLYDHQPYRLNRDDYERVCQIPMQKGANFRDLPGVKVVNKKVQLDTSVERPLISSGNFLVPNYAITYVNGKSKKPFGRLWWDEIVNTVVTRPEPHNQCLLHPEQNRVLTVRENARIQGFPDFYKLCGPIKEKYIQVGNAVSVPVGVALGYAFGKASERQTGKESEIEFPFTYPKCLQPVAVESSDVEA